MHSWTGTPCAPLTDEPLAKGFTVGSTTDSADPDVREDIGEGGARPRYRQTGCLAGLTGPDGASWKLYTTADVYEESPPAHGAYRVKHDLDRVHGRGPERVHATAYAKPVDDQGRPGRALLLWNGDLLLTVTAYGPYGSKAHDVREGLQDLVENTARLVEDALRDRDAPPRTVNALTAPPRPASGPGPGGVGSLPGRAFATRSSHSFISAASAVLSPGPWASRSRALNRAAAEGTSAAPGSATAGSAGAASGVRMEACTASRTRRDTSASSKVAGRATSISAIPTLADMAIWAASPGATRIRPWATARSRSRVRMRCDSSVAAGGVRIAGEFIRR